MNDKLFAIVLALVTSRSPESLGQPEQRQHVIAVAKALLEDISNAN